MPIQNKVLSKTLRIENGKLLRTVEDVSAIEKLIEILEKKGYIGKTVINTEIYPREDKLVEHEILKYIIHSGEYTESMAYDVNQLSLKMALDLVDEGAYAYDLLPHNFTFHNGNWFLYDFDSFQLKPEKVITEIRGFFKIIFSNYEVLRLISRAELKYYYLTRYRIEDIIKLIPFTRWLYLFFNQTICNLLYMLKAYKFSYLYIKKLFHSYSKKHKKEYYNYIKNPNNDILSEIIKQNNISCVFCVGEEAGKWAIDDEQLNSSIKKAVYIDDYKICDDYYNYIVQNQFKNIVPAVLYPLVDDNEIPNEYNYRAIYDSYAQERFYSDSVIALDCLNEDKKMFINNLSKFTSNLLILSSKSYDNEDLNYIKTLYEDVYIDENYIIAKGKLNKSAPLAKNPYKDGNRGPDAHRQTWEILKLLKNKKSITNN